MGNQQFRSQRESLDILGKQISSVERRYKEASLADVETFIHAARKSHSLAGILINCQTDFVLDLFVRSEEDYRIAKVDIDATIDEGMKNCMRAISALKRMEREVARKSGSRGERCAARHKLTPAGV